jgi:hypothetical protein
LSAGNNIIFFDEAEDVYAQIKNVPGSGKRSR